MIKIALVEENIQAKELILKHIEAFENVCIENVFDNLSEIDLLDEIDLIIFDINSKNCESAFKQVERLKKEKLNLNFIATSFEINSNLVSETLSKGVSDFLLKPIIPNVLEASIMKNVSVCEKRAKTITVFSNKGGIGKTSTAINLAYEIQKQTQSKVCILDLSFNSEDVALFLNIEQKYDLDYIVSNIGHYDKEKTLSLMGKYGDSDLYILEAKEELMPDLKFTSDKVSKVINVLKNIFDYLIIDTSSLINEFNVSVLNNSDLILLISTTNLNSLKNCQKCYELFDKIGYSSDKIKLIINRYLENQQAGLQDIENNIEKKVFSVIPNNYLTLIDAINVGKCTGETNPQSNIAKAYKKLANEIIQIDFEALKTNNNYNHGIFNLLKRMGE